MRRFRDKTTLTEKVVCLKESNKQAFAPKALQSILLKLAHDSPLSGHHAFDKTLERLSRYWYWEEIKDDVKFYCQACQICGKVNNPPHSRPIPLETLGPARCFNDRVHIDLMGPLPTDQGMKYAMIMIDAFSKLIQVSAIPDKTMNSVSLALFNDWITLHGVCKTIVSDQGKEFHNSLFKSLGEKLKIQHNFSSVAHPMSNGQAERSVRNCVHYFRKYLNGSNHWVTLLPSLRMALNTSIHSSSKHTPFFAAFAREPSLPETLQKPQQALSYSEVLLEQQLQQLINIRYDILEAESAAFASQKAAFDKRSRDKTVQLGDKVFVLAAKSGSQFQKFQPKYKGPYVITKLLANNNLELTPYFPQSSKTQGKPIITHKNNVKLTPFVQQHFPDSVPSPSEPKTALVEPPQIPTTLMTDGDEDTPIHDNEETVDPPIPVVLDPVVDIPVADPVDIPTAPPAVRPAPGPPRADPPRATRSSGTALSDDITSKYPPTRKTRKDTGQPRSRGSTPTPGSSSSSTTGPRPVGTSRSRGSTPLPGSSTGATRRTTGARIKDTLKKLSPPKKSKK